MRDMLALMLELAGASVITAANGVEACNMARTHLPCLIILDLMMPMILARSSAGHSSPVRRSGRSMLWSSPPTMRRVKSLGV